jgi:hypothetical protein
MRSRGVVILTAAGLVAASAVAHPAWSQSLFQNLFGFESSPGEARRNELVPSLRSFGRFGASGGRSYSAYGNSYDGEPDPRSYGSYRTVCVRMCDGYYWPLSSKASRSSFYRDAKVCEASCAGEARLFYLPSASDDIGSMVDLTGRAYGRLETAFLYRKSLVSSCACKPAPWSQVEAMRHQTYAAVAAMEDARVSADAAASRDDTGELAKGASESTSLPEGAEAGETTSFNAPAPYVRPLSRWRQRGASSLGARVSRPDSGGLGTGWSVVP